MDPLHRVTGRERQRADEHLVKGHTEGIEITPRINGTVHPPSLFWSHVGQRPSNHLQRLRSLPVTGQPRGQTKARQPAAAGEGISQDISWLNILVDDAPLM